MLSDQITKHPFFHDKSHEEIKKILTGKPDGACLFSKGKKENELFLWYTANFKEEKQVRSYHVKSPEEFNSLYEAADSLTKFLEGFADNKFVPIPHYSKPLVSKITRNVEDSYDPILNVFSSDILSKNMFPKLNAVSVLTLSDVSTKWNKFIDDKHVENAIKNEDEALRKKAEMRHLLMKEVAEKLFERLPVNSNDTLHFGKYVISEPQEYSMSVNFYKLKIYSNAINYVTYDIRVDKKGNIEFMPEHENISDDMLFSLKKLANDGKFLRDMANDDASHQNTQTNFSSYGM